VSSGTQYYTAETLMVKMKGIEVIKELCEKWLGLPFGQAMVNLHFFKNINVQSATAW
jgi:hypothetical protein